MSELSNSAVSGVIGVSHEHKNTFFNLLISAVTFFYILSIRATTFTCHGNFLENFNKTACVFEAFTDLLKPTSHLLFTAYGLGHPYLSIHPYLDIDTLKYWYLVGQARLNCPYQT